MKTVDLILLMITGYTATLAGLLAICAVCYVLFWIFSKETGEHGNNSNHSNSFRYRNGFERDCKLLYLRVLRGRGKAEKHDCVGRWIYSRLHRRA